MLERLKNYSYRALLFVRRVLLGRLSAPAPLFESLRAIETSLTELRGEMDIVAQAIAPTVGTPETEQLARIEIALGAVHADVLALPDADRTGVLEQAIATLRADIAHLARTAPVGDAPHGEMLENNLIDQQIKMAEYYLKTAMGDIAPGFKPLYERCKSYTTASVEQLYAVHTAVEHVVYAEIPGDIVDCGAGRGGTALMAALTLGSLGALDRRIVLLDSYDVIPPGSERASISAADVRRLVETSGYPMNLVELTAGMLEISTANLPAGRVAVLRLDTNNYATTTAALEDLYDRIAEGGILMAADVGALIGPRQATDDFLAERGKPMMLSRVDYCTRMGVKPASRTPVVP